MEWIGGGFWPPYGCQETPSRPTFEEVVTVSLSDVWPDSCVPTGSAVSVDGDSVHFDVYHDYPPHQICYDSFAPWSESHELGSLASGEYKVVTTLFENGQVRFWGIETCTFAVDPQPVQTIIVPLPELAGVLEYQSTDTAPIQTGRQVFDARDAVLTIKGVLETGLYTCESGQYALGGTLHSMLEHDVSEPLGEGLYGPLPATQYPFEIVQRFRDQENAWLAELTKGNASLRLWFDGTYEIVCETTQYPKVYVDSVTLVLRALLVHDYNRNGAIALDDFMAWGWCFSGPDVFNGPICAVFDADCDRDVDLRDVASFQTSLGK